MRALILSIFTAFSVSVFGQNTAVVDEKANILSYLITDKRTVFLSPDIDTFSLSKIQKRLSNSEFIRRITRNDTLHIDTFRLSTDERKYVLDKLQSSMSYKWTKTDMVQNGLSRFTLLDSLQEERNPDFNFIVYRIMQPILLRDNNYAFAYYDYACGPLCGHGELVILVKKDGKWQRWWTLFEFDS